MVRLPRHTGATGGSLQLGDTQIRLWNIAAPHVPAHSRVERSDYLGAFLLPDPANLVDALPVVTLNRNTIPEVN